MPVVQNLYQVFKIPASFLVKNEDGEWDNNNDENYIFKIEKPETGLIVIDNYGEKSLRRLRKSYILTKKIKLAIYKLLISIPKLISGNYKKKLTDND